MPTNAVLVNTSRGGLVDSIALADALERADIAAAALDVFETEPLPAGHRLRSAPNLILTPHVAFFSATSLTNLQRLAAEEVHRALRGVPLRGAVS
jgi:D-3-phosphoglycerate dehydrogenase